MPTMARKVFRLVSNFQRRFWLLITCLCLVCQGLTGCAHRPSGWGFPGGQGTIDRQKSRAVVHDPFPLNDIAPEVVGGRPREFFSPQSEAVREATVPLQYRNVPSGYGY
ncbi:MAG TPA: hypothetical protein DCF63_18165 [Planctomycetaceae bacterium]|nr:hypothetical protein [Planctomycetaceae bacterium]